MVIFRTVFRNISGTHHPEHSSTRIGFFYTIQLFFQAMCQNHAAVQSQAHF